MGFKSRIEKTWFFSWKHKVYIYEKASNPTLKRYHVILLS